MPFALKRFANSQAHTWVYTYHVDWEEKAAYGASSAIDDGRMTAMSAPREQFKPDDAVDGQRPTDSAAD
ncbi:MAG TPA: hypothetical protein VHM23_04380 [Actinomycetota bacterium]|jgi:hypothetical protein|nr:hypothetical protein [Actinomycetota bacterium]